MTCGICYDVGSCADLVASYDRRVGLAFCRLPTRQVPLSHHFSNVVAGALLLASELNWVLAERLVALYLSFNVLLYTGLYTLNDLADRASDAAHPLKRHRPIASGRVTIRRAIVWTVVFLSAGFGTGAWFGAPILSCYVAVVAINLLYSAGGRNVVYLDVLLNGLPHVVRFLMGALLVTRRPPLTHLIAFLFVTVAFG